MRTKVVYYGVSRIKNHRKTFAKTIKGSLGGLFWQRYSRCRRACGNAQHRPTRLRDASRKNNTDFPNSNINWAPDCICRRGRNGRVRRLLSQHRADTATNLRTAIDTAINGHGKHAVLHSLCGGRITHRKFPAWRQFIFQARNQWRFQTGDRDMAPESDHFRFTDFARIRRMVPKYFLQTDFARGHRFPDGARSGLYRAQLSCERVGRRRQPTSFRYDSIPRTCLRQLRDS